MRESINTATCKQTITRISSCRANLIPKLTVEHLITTSWNPRAATQVIDTFNEAHYYFFENPDRTQLDMNLMRWAISARAAHEMCFNRGFVGGHMTGHQFEGKFGIACSTAGAVWRDAIVAEVANSGWPFSVVDDVNWAQAQRAASHICANAKQGYVGGHFNGHYTSGTFGPGAFGLMCYGFPAQWFDASVAEINATGWPLGDLNSVGWAQAARAATTYCERKGFVAGFMTGHQIPDKYGVVCQRRGLPVGAVDVLPSRRLPVDVIPRIRRLP